TLTTDEHALQLLNTLFEHLVLRLIGQEGHALAVDHSASVDHSAPVSIDAVSWLPEAIEREAAVSEAEVSEGEANSAGAVLCEAEANAAEVPETSAEAAPIESLLRALDRLQRKALMSLKSGQESSAPLLLEMHGEANPGGADTATMADHSRIIAATIAPAMTLISQLFATARNRARNRQARSADVEELLARLHVPLLKLAVIDPEGIRNTDHPGRVLLQLLVEASERTNASGRLNARGRTVAPSQGVSSRTLIEACTTRILRDFVRDTGVFQQVSAGLNLALQRSEKTNFSAGQGVASGHSDRATIELGTWVLLSRSDAPALRCRLHSVSEAEDRYTFENQRGFEVLALSGLELALALITGDLRILTDSDCFEHSLVTLIGAGQARAASV
ncbi:MAG: DUF1631 family protein, partial [Gammaproteobacteria bacterium]